MSKRRRNPSIQVLSQEHLREWLDAYIHCDDDEDDRCPVRDNVPPLLVIHPDDRLGGLWFDYMPLGRHDGWRIRLPGHGTFALPTTTARAAEVGWRKLEEMARRRNPRRNPNHVPHTASHYVKRQSVAGRCRSLAVKIRSVQMELMRVHEVAREVCGSPTCDPLGRAQRFLDLAISEAQAAAAESVR